MAAVALFRLCAAAEPLPALWPEQFTAIMLRNGTNNSDGSPTQISILRKCYDYSDPETPTLKHECTTNGIASTFLALGTDAYIFTSLTGACERSTLPVTVVTRDWMRGGEYAGVETVNAVPSHKVIRYDKVSQVD